MSESFDKNSKKNVILFALLLSVICSVLIAAAAGGLRELQQANMELDKKINILKAAAIIEDRKPSKEKINKLYDAHIKEVLVDDQGKLLEARLPNSLTLYFFKENGNVKGYILPINTRGLWGKIQGYLAFEADGQTVSGFSVFSHAETPGLGGEIESAWFQKNFKGKKILNSQNKFVSIGIAKGKSVNLPKEKQDHYVDGISGATLTGRYLSEGIKKTLIAYDAVSIKFRQKQLRAQKDTQEKEILLKDNK
ncbi:MAG: FMN-binding protein [Desulfobacula sp.]|jgi:Na+-transporting NADH:ubiquinone oxidoreductase subunit C|uniref:FMN-binding protein n=1 Tax=Desulfobacula sp. TaxID=2593537 RepID=UPI001D93E3BC|nr:FMN-binding protein [Desulfobacula sp.]MBT3486771.1 FMN-binding protein [Desulfobacula sp.]MBT3806391.1 FMN-binding protein [Desulfobacula sp.]MBT4023971.1 FMN-binding protein [Desulfobacula sp.]MBT4198333.1 FMN-binding protein [Desulfobacula sp.]